MCLLIYITKLNLRHAGVKYVTAMEEVSLSLFVANVIFELD